MTDRTYATPEAFKNALDQRLRRIAQDKGNPIARVRQVLVFERFLARVFQVLGERVIVKGGVVLELRLERARTTRDVDLRVIGSADALLGQLEAAAALDLLDFMTFSIERDRHHPTLEGDGLVYEGQRFRVEPRIAGKVYGSAFGLDVGFGDILTSAPEVLMGSNILDFAGIEPPTFRIYAREAHIAEKLHAYTLPRPRENSRVKDLPDIALLATTGPFDAVALRAALDATFGFRKTHALPTTVPTPPASWTETYARMAAEDHLPWNDIVAVHEAAGAFLDPVLGEAVGHWDHERWRWT